MKRVISIMLLGEEWARVVEGKFEVLIESKNPRVSSRTMLLEYYNDSFYNHKDASTFDQRFQLVKEKKYFCYSKPGLELIARILDD